MFQITNSAAEQLKMAIDSSENDNTCFRIGVTGDKVQMVVDQERPGDTALEHEGTTVLVMDAVAKERLDDQKLDFESDSSSLVLKKAE